MSIHHDGLILLPVSSVVKVIQHGFAFTVLINCCLKHEMSRMVDCSSEGSCKYIIFQAGEFSQGCGLGV